MASATNFYDCIRQVLQAVDDAGSLVQNVMQTHYGKKAGVGVGRTRIELHTARSLPVIGITEGDEVTINEGDQDMSAIGDLRAIRELVIFMVVPRGKHVQVLDEAESALVEMFHRKRLGEFRFEFQRMDSDYDTAEETAARAVSFAVTYTKYSL